MEDDLNAPGAAAQISLREQLGGAADPDFTLRLPPGWVRRTPDDAEQQRMTAAVRTRLMGAHRPDLYARMRGLLTEAFAKMKETSTVALFLPDEAAPDALYLPASLTASVLRAEPGTTLDAVVQAAVTREGATPLMDDRRFLRAERDEEQSLDDETARITTVVYLTPIPGSGRRRALQLTLVVVRPADAPADDPTVLRIKTLFDLCVSSLTWVPAGSAA